MVSAPGSGSRWRAAFAYFDRGSCSWKTCQDSLLEAKGECCTTWPTEGTWDGGYAYEAPMSELPTGESASSSWPLLPTPDAGHFNDGQSVEVYLRRKAENLAKKINGNGFGTPLAMAVRLLPTPTAMDANSSGSRNLPGSKAHPGVSLTDAVRTGDSTTSRRTAGASTSPPSDIGSEPWDGPHPDQLTIEAGSTLASWSGCSASPTDGST